MIAETPTEKRTEKAVEPRASSSAEYRVEVTADDIMAAAMFPRRDARYNPVARAFSRALGRDVMVGQGPSFASPQDKHLDHRDWTAYLGETRWQDLILPPRWQKFLNWWTYGRAGSPEDFDRHVRAGIALKFTQTS